jgi:hypothetical protein
LDGFFRREKKETKFSFFLSQSHLLFTYFLYLFIPSPFPLKNFKLTFPKLIIFLSYFLYYVFFPNLINLYIFYFFLHPTLWFNSISYTETFKPTPYASRLNSIPSSLHPHSASHYDGRRDQFKFATWGENNISIRTHLGHTLVLSRRWFRPHVGSIETLVPSTRWFY